jgi:hypothetical protein
MQAVVAELVLGHIISAVPDCVIARANPGPHPHCWVWVSEVEGHVPAAQVKHTLFRLITTWT